MNSASSHVTILFLIFATAFHASGGELELTAIRLADVLATRSGNTLIDQAKAIAEFQRLESRRGGAENAQLDHLISKMNSAINKLPRPTQEEIFPTKIAFTPEELEERRADVKRRLNESSFPTIESQRAFIEKAIQELESESVRKEFLEAWRRMVLQMYGPYGLGHFAIGESSDVKARIKDSEPKIRGILQSFQKEQKQKRREYVLQVLKCLDEEQETKFKSFFGMSVDRFAASFEQLPVDRFREALGAEEEKLAPDFGVKPPVDAKGMQKFIERFGVSEPKVERSQLKRIVDSTQFREIGRKVVYPKSEDPIELPRDYPLTELAQARQFRDFMGSTSALSSARFISGAIVPELSLEQVGELQKIAQKVDFYWRTDVSPQEMNERRFLPKFEKDKPKELADFLLEREHEIESVLVPAQYRLVPVLVLYRQGFVWVWRRPDIAEHFDVSLRQAERFEQAASKALDQYDDFIKTSFAELAAELQRVYALDSSYGDGEEFLQGLIAKGKFSKASDWLTNKNEPELWWFDAQKEYEAAIRKARGR